MLPSIAFAAEKGALETQSSEERAITTRTESLDLTNTATTDKAATKG